MNDQRGRVSAQFHTYRSLYLEIIGKAFTVIKSDISDSRNYLRKTLNNVNASVRICVFRSCLRGIFFTPENI